MAPIELPPAELLRNLLDYNPVTGILTWKPKPEAFHAAAHWNNHYAGKEAGSARGDGYRRISINGKGYSSHRIAWLLHYGTVPTEIDHVNGKRDDNRIINLRNVTTAENRKNHAKPSNNTSGVVGVVWSRAIRRWNAQIKVNRKCIFLGSFATIEEAAAARKCGEVAFGFHENHGRERHDVLF